MAADFPELSSMEETRKDMWKRRLRFIHKMTSGIVYSILMHSLLITAYVFLIKHFLDTTEADMQLMDVCVPIFFSYGIASLAEVGIRWFDPEPEYQIIVIKLGHFAHCIGCYWLLGYTIPINDNIGSLPTVFAGLLIVWTVLVFTAFIILDLMGDNSFTQLPLLV